MRKPEFSIIIPIYNVESYLSRCIDSVLCQRIIDFELLLIDDGSNDLSGRICDDYANKDTRISVYHKANGGVSSARNLGLQMAKGRWIWFVDSDDWIEANALDVIYNGIIEDEKIDLFEYSFYINKNTVTRSFFNSDRKIIGNAEIMGFFLSFPKFHLWNKIIKKELVNDIIFAQNITIGEDFLFLSMLFDKIETYKYIPISIYNYDNRNNSAMASLNKEKYLDSITDLIHYIENKKDFFKLNNYTAILAVFINKKRLCPLIQSDKITKALLCFWRKISFFNIIASNLFLKQKIYVFLYKFYTFIVKYDN